MKMTLDTVYLNIGFPQNSVNYYLLEDAEINTIVDHLKIEYYSFPLNIDDEKENLFLFFNQFTYFIYLIDVIRLQHIYLLSYLKFYSKTSKRTTLFYFLQIF